MLRRILTSPLIALSSLALMLLGATPAVAANETVLYYDDGQAAEYTSAVSSAVDVWNSAVDNVRLEPVPDGQHAEILIIADDDWPRAHLGPVRPGGQVTVWMGRQGTAEGYDAVRIAAHELGHSLGLPDAKPGPCSSLMSGSSAGVDCTSAEPDDSERSRVESGYGGGPAGQRDADGGILVDRA